ncbi:autophagy-related protein 27 [Lasiosphaeria hispida]|uniref:Autophagy-related protein 27 n=1 Tax=Lasiosphaeria hispida TaxID=260671 RepID=A0AAJ0HAE0_9PEZI|nr:autophagy-related protein 27 [Lasiosphaeria hispida]
MQPPARWPLAAFMMTGAVLANIPCEKLEVDGARFDLSALKGPHAVVTGEFAPPSHYNRTYTVDLCAPLKKPEGAAKEEACPDGTRVCAIKKRWDAETKKETVEEVIPVAGDLAEYGGKAFGWEAKRLRTVGEGVGEGDSKYEGLRVTLKGGIYEHREQKAVIEFRCDNKLEGTEGEWKEEGGKVKREGEEKKEDGEKKDDEKKGDDDKNKDKEGTPETQRKKEGAALIWEGYKLTQTPDGKEQNTLSLTWYTKHACEKAVVDEPLEESGSWGFFTWIVILAFLAIASYLIFGSWLNYNRYGARGWDLLPHGDTLRDIPYLLKDWTRRVLNTVQSSGSRGGYSAV